MRKSNRVMPALLTAAALASAMILAGCTPDESDSSAETPAPVSASPSAAASPSPSLEGSAAPEYSAEETAAIESAKAAATRFFEVRNAVFSDPENAGAEPFVSVAIDPVRSVERGKLGNRLKQGLRSSGKTVVEFADVRSVTPESNPEEFIYPKVVLDICVDVSNVDVIDSSGKSVVGNAADRQVAVIGAYEEPGEGWLIERLDYLEDGDSCKQ